MIHLEKQDEFTIIRLTGRLDGITMGEVESTFLDAVAAGEQRFIMDLKGLEYISSAGLRVMLLAIKKTKAIGGKLVLFGLAGTVEEVFQMSGFTAIFSIVNTEQEAVEAILTAGGV